MLAKQFAVLQLGLSQPRIDNEDENILRIFKIMKEQQHATLLRGTITESSKMKP